MYNYGNLSDVEFEDLCRDVMSTILGAKLRTFTQGRDKGIDICDSVEAPKIVIQVKHYFRSSFSDLKRSLANEKSKIEKLGVEQYYICTSKGLTPGNVQELFGMFSEYMQDSSNIISYKEIDKFLDSERGRDVLRRHHKLWLTSNMMTEALQRDAFIDGDVLLADIEQEKQYFVPTMAYFRTIDNLKERRITILTGKPGCGKTISSEMISLHMSNNGYRVIYVSDSYIRSIKKLFSHDPKVKEMVYLDDCFGQRYFEMKLEVGKELSSLIKYVKMNPNKCLLMNSRISIFQEAKNRFIEFVEEIENDTVSVVNINMDEISLGEKARILYNHLYFDGLPEEYIEGLKQKRGYRKIVSHPNYMPRLIKRLTRRDITEKTSPEEYCGYILDMLGKPKWIWEDEYKNRLQNVDRIFVNTLYSLTDTLIPVLIHKRAFAARILQENIDTTASPWEDSKRRLVNNMIQIAVKDGEEMLCVADPSVNDYLDICVKENAAEIDRIISSATEYAQYFRLRPKAIADKVKDGTFLSLKFNSEVERDMLILSHITEDEIFQEKYKEIIDKFYKNPNMLLLLVPFTWISKIYMKLLTPKFKKFYNTGAYLCRDNMSRFMECAALDGLEKFFSYVRGYELDYILEKYEDEIMAGVVRSIEEYAGGATREDYYEGNVGEVLSEHTTIEEFGPVTDYEGAAWDVFNEIKDAVYDDICGLLNTFPKPFCDIDDLYELVDRSLEISETEIESYIESYYRDFDAEDYYYENYRDQRADNINRFSEADRVFR